MASLSKKIRVLIAEDSAFMRRIISDAVNSDPALEVIATAANGSEACRKALALKPDVITMDIEMPVMDGLSALERLMKEHPVPVVMLSALTQSGASATITALEKGAVDFISKPGSITSMDIDQLSREIVLKLRVAAQVQVKSLRVTTPEPEPSLTGLGTGKKRTDRGSISLVVIGTSTGGPKALHEIMSTLPSGLNAAILIVQHMPPGFTKSLAQRLDSVSRYKVKEAEEGDIIERDRAYVAPGNFHMEVREEKGRLCLGLSQNPQVNGHRPSADVLFYSAAKVRTEKVGVILTGMGGDGALGLKALKESGAITLGESPETCVVYGMPKVAMQHGAVDHELPLYRISAQILDSLSPRNLTAERGKR